MRLFDWELFEKRIVIVVTLVKNLLKVKFGSVLIIEMLHTDRFQASDEPSVVMSHQDTIAKIAHGLMEE